AGWVTTDDRRPTTARGSPDRGPSLVIPTSWAPRVCFRGRDLPTTDDRRPPAARPIVVRRGWFLPAGYQEIVSGGAICCRGGSAQLRASDSASPAAGAGSHRRGARV